MSDYSYFCGIDLAKNHFSIHAVDQHGKVLLHKPVTRSKLLTKIANMPAMRIDLEACGGAHYWARTLRKLGHDPRIIAAKHVTPYRTKGKNDLNDAVAIGATHADAFEHLKSLNLHINNAERNFDVFAEVSNNEQRIMAVFSHLIKYPCLQPVPP